MLLLAGVAGVPAAILLNGVDAFCCALGGKGGMASTLL
jgi:hypothetical protein